MIRTSKGVKHAKPISGTASIKFKIGKRTKNAIGRTRAIASTAEAIWPSGWNMMSNMAHRAESSAQKILA
ncbi:hypothetical protein GCM10011585_34470 [Edaphobacter dinghuensis]|uniref:Uncharacterized protein n=1 Tax=Edaphobacter dinghuensis TaxID=1560005 RepID=A0A917HRP0_9BACT|nr:hypothetical protein GCM10011585_34470 [Edaphobacter dinghuensis]